MEKELDFWEQINETLEKQFPKGECKERGNALVLNAIFNMQFNNFIKRLKKPSNKKDEPCCKCGICKSWLRRIDKLCREKLSK